MDLEKKTGHALTVKHLKHIYLEAKIKKKQVVQQPKSESANQKNLEKRELLTIRLFERLQYFFTHAYRVIYSDETSVSDCGCKLKAWSLPYLHIWASLRQKRRQNQYSFARFGAFSLKKTSCTFQVWNHGWNSMSQYYKEPILRANIMIMHNFHTMMLEMIKLPKKML